MRRPRRSRGRSRLAAAEGADLRLKTLTYTSFARLDLGDEDLLAILRVAREFNALHGITGLLIFNGTRFLQRLEGVDESIDELVERIRADPRHSGFEVRHEGPIAVRSFPEWSMELVKVKSDYFAASDTLADRLPRDLPSEVRELILDLTEQISGVIDVRG